MNQLGVTIFAVGVGNFFLAEVEALASQPINRVWQASFRVRLLILSSTSSLAAMLPLSPTLLIALALFDGIACCIVLNFT